jgi:prolyl-tRNA editing enzyme YbaK/EbsC (Cys-tRNA(Pro) deacylase)
VYLDKAAEAQEAILVNAGQRGVNLKVGVTDLVRVLNVMVLELTDVPESEPEDNA